MTQVGFFSMTGGPLSGDEDAYLRWHLLDHMPEQFTIPGLRLGTRWRADDACVDLRAAADDRLAPVRHVVCYLMTDPVQETLAAFAALGRRCAEEGRYPEPATSFLLGGYHLLRSHAAPRVLVSDEVIPFRPHRGAYVVVEHPVDGADVDGWLRWHHQEHVPAILAVDGVAGACAFRSSSLVGIGPDQGARYGVPMWDPGDRIITVLYLDGDVADTSRRLEPAVRSRWATGAVAAELAGPFRSMTTHTAWPDPG